MARPLSRLLCRALLLASLGLVVAVLPVRAAQTPEMTAAYTVDTGNAFVDAALRDVNHYVERHPDAFLDELEWFADGNRRQLSTWLAAAGHQGADLYFGCQLAVILERSCAAVMADFDAAGPSGWNGVLEALPQPLSAAQWSTLEDRIRASWQRWARPLPAVPGKRRR